ncbi:hypothetical protein DAPPUDRAFT_246394 [Daphnia pulex]|uniref:Uncharacterized protein n=1 Tax=Daphnia pulex TaxID=6669 RepID=E9GQE1_DAPPU|nr:hypothetical protein DAPPUDRAFT_246394 [Daphnia pulex]|eukprot:EFX78356.1 hypothetical protein DAPPUDRAFT_246394 [Daphnia pulex]
MLKREHFDRLSSRDIVIQLKSIKEKLAEKEWELRQLCKERHVNLNKFKSLIQFGIDINSKDNYGQNALHLLCANNSSNKLIDAIKLLIQLGINVQEKDQYGDDAINSMTTN